MKFGKEFRIHLEETLPEWRDKYLQYKPLKKLLKSIPAADNPPPDGPSPELHEWFVGILNEELEKFNDFYVDKEEDFIIRFQALKERIERLKSRGSTNSVFTSETEFSEEMMEIRKDFVSIHGEMVLLKNYSSLNFAGLIKILKKYDKRTGELLSLPFTQLAVHQPFFMTEPVTRLVRECEENLELLFPQEAEVVESTSIQQKQNADPPNASSELKLAPGEETVDIYRSTLAAIKAIKCLKKASSTYNPLSLSYIFGNQDNDVTGAVTAENSPRDSLVTLPKEEDATEDVCSPV
ncbi:SPX domain-containing protein 4-like [Salvia splendens]|uniref:SPX domain-containing protein 4-like n=1 Tax=Salvia splendens TaxID=180675 RepID=UPI001C27F094|nr:SPX domain-containing protein 4-like [Salvia splendens]